MVVHQFKRRIYILFIFLGNHTFGQTFIAGDTLDYYIDLIPDTSLKYQCSTSNISSEKYYIDVNIDSSADIEFHSYCAVGGTFTSQFIDVKSLNNSCKFIFERSDSVFNNFGSYWMVMQIAKPLNYLDTINNLSTTIWKDSLKITASSYMTGTSQSITDWLDTNSKYLAVRYIDFVDTLYGWIRIICPYSNECTVMDYSFSRGTVNIESLEINKFKIYPNPTQGHLFIKSSMDEDYEISITNLLGKIVLTASINNGNENVDLSFLSSGIYFISCKFQNKFFTKKIILQ